MGTASIAAIIMGKHTVLPAPNAKISPLIRGARYAMLISGIIYGYKRHASLSAYEKDLQLYIDDVKEKRGERIAKEKAAANREEMIKLAGDFSVEVPPDY